MMKFIISISIIIIFLGCAGKKPKDELDYQQKYDRGMAFLEKEKYVRAQEEFSALALTGSHTELGDDAIFYLGEAYFKNKEYILAIAEYERLIRRMGFSPFVEEARWRICESLVNESPKYYHDQEFSQKALQRLQEFLEDYPKSEYKTNATDAIQDLRNKLSKKMYETANLYIKLSAYDSAIIAFNNILDTYYDTEYVAKSHVGIIRCQSALGNLTEARDYLNITEDILKKSDLLKKANNYILNAEQKLKKKKK